MKRMLFCVVIVNFLVLSNLPIVSEQSTHVLGGSTGWNAISKMHGLTYTTGQLGYTSLSLDTLRTNIDPDEDDAYVSFDTSASFVSGGMDQTGKYSIIKSSFLPSQPPRIRRGTGSANSTGSGGMIIRGSPGSLFGNQGIVGSFTIEFWLYPAVTENGGVLFYWRSTRSTSDSPFQYIHAGLNKNHLEWTFSNIWSFGRSVLPDVVLKGQKNLIPKTWSHHAVSYDSSNGTIEYRVDGSLEAISYLDSPSSIKGNIYSAYFGVPADISIAPSYSGLIDEFRIRRSPLPLGTLESMHELRSLYPSEGGRFESSPLDSGGSFSTVSSFAVQQSLPAGTGTEYYIRSGENPYQWTDQWPQWQPIEIGSNSSAISGRYFQIAAYLYPDGSGLLSPTVTSIELTYHKDSLPWPPSRIFVQSYSASVALSWTASIDSDVEGYLVYFGERPGEYLAQGSPVDVGKVLEYTMPNLVNGKLYYFSVAAYDRSGVVSPGPLSAEVFARPLAVHREKPTQ